MTKTGKAAVARGIAALLIAGGAFALRQGARASQSFADTFRARICPVMNQVLGRISDLVPFSLVEILIYGILAVTAVWLIRMIACAAITRFRGDLGRLAARGISRWMLLASLIFLLYEMGEDVYFYATPFSQVYGYGTGSYDTKELEAVCRDLAEESNAWSGEVERNADGIMVLSDGIRERIVTAMHSAGEIWPALAGFYSRPKGVLISALMSHTNMAGIYSAYTCEANYNRDMTAYNIPYTMCHELSHTKGVLMENEANFTAYLVTRGSGEPDIRYSGAMMGWIYCGNELYKRDYEKWLAIEQTLNADVRRDLEANTAFWERYKTPVAEKAQSLNDSYLKSHGQKDGAASYDRVVDLIISYERIKEG